MERQDRKEQDVTALAKACIAEAGNVQDATAIMRERLLADDRMYREAMDPMVAARAYDLVRSVCRAERRMIWTAPNYTPAGNGERVITAARASLLDMRLPNGLRLADATANDLMDAMGFYQRQARTMDHMARWLEAVARKVKNKRVGDVLSDAALRKMQEQTDNE